MASSGVVGDKYRSYLTPEDLENTQWIDGPPNYDVVNKLFEEGRTNVWADGSLEEYVQNLVKTWEMELVHKANPDEYKTFEPKEFIIGNNGKRYFTLEEVKEIGGSYQVFLQTSLPPALRLYNPDEETYESSQSAFKQMNEEKKIVKVEFFYDRGELLAALIKGKTFEEPTGDAAASLGCPFMA